VFRPVVLVKLAQRKRKETGDERYYAPMENDKFTFLKRAEDILAKPFKILFQEPMMIAIAIYMSVCDHHTDLIVAILLTLRRSSCTDVFISSSKHIPSCSPKGIISTLVLPV